MREIRQNFAYFICKDIKYRFTCRPGYWLNLLLWSSLEQQNQARRINAENSIFLCRWNWLRYLPPPVIRSITCTCHTGKRKTKGEGEEEKGLMGWNTDLHSIYKHDLHPSNQREGERSDMGEYRQGSYISLVLLARGWRGRYN
jgi:hypothetical protein